MVYPNLVNKAQVTSTVKSVQVQYSPAPGIPAVFDQDGNQFGYVAQMELIVRPDGDMKAKLYFMEEFVPVPGTIGGPINVFSIDVPFTFTLKP